MTDIDMEALCATVPLSFVPEAELRRLAGRIGVEEHKKGTVLFVQGLSRVDKFYIIRQGSAEKYFDQGKEKILKDVLGEGDSYGGICILMNDRVSVRTLSLTEDTSFYTLPAEDFLDLCNRVPPFRDYFTNTFGISMQNRSYAGIISRQIKSKDEALPFFSQTVSGLSRTDLVTCGHDTSIQEAAKIMTRRKVSSIFIRDKDGLIDGIMTDNDIRSRVVATGVDVHRPAREIMSSPLKSIRYDAQIFEAYTMIMQDRLKHLPLRNERGEVVGVITDKDLIAAQGDSPYLLIREIQSAGSIDTIIRIHRRLPEILRVLIQSGAKAGNLSKLVTAVSDAILKRIIGFAVDTLGDPPCRFAFMVMGSEGRAEQTLKTDQDNAILYETIFEDHEHERIRDYFLRLGNLVCTWLDKAGFSFCEGNNMAKNPQWCQPIDVWKGYFHDWVRKADPEDLLRASIFFDFKGAWGDRELVNELRDFLFRSLQGWSGFFRSLTENALYFKPPIGFFRNIVVESKGEHKDSFDIKRAMLPIVDFARIYALKNGIRETNTLTRLHQVYVKKVLTQQEYDDVDQAYNYLLQLRFVRQVSAVVDENRPPNNFCNPNTLSRLDQAMLKEIFKRIEKLQLKLSLEFTGII
jgi:CBS domain-containing protein